MENVRYTNFEHQVMIALIKRRIEELKLEIQNNMLNAVEEQPYQNKLNIEGTIYTQNIEDIKTKIRLLDKLLNKKVKDYNNFLNS